VDTAKPASSASSPDYSTSSSIKVDYTASDSGSDLDKVELWAKGPTDSSYSKVDTDGTPSGSGESFNYAASQGDGTYRFYTIAYDKAGNAETAPGSEDDSTVVDSANPSSSADSPATSNSNSFNVAYSASDATSGLSKVELWAKGPTDGSYNKVATDSTPSASGESFSYTASQGDGTYSFYTVATDKAGNDEKAPASADDSTVVDTAKPASAATAPASSSTTSIGVSYTAGDGSGTGLKDVELWAKGPKDSSYSKVDTDSTPSASGESFSYTAGQGDGTYSFYTRAHDKATNYEDAPASPDATTTLTTTTAFKFTGFFSPVDNLPMLNSVKAGAAVPVKFSLGGDKGLSIFGKDDSGNYYPKSQSIPCDSNAAIDGIETTVTAGGSSLSYDPTTQIYTYVWKTQKSWAGSCRQLIVGLNDGTDHAANFTFR
jgi:hypothetical protein